MENLKVKLKGINRYSFTDERTGRLVEGCNVHFEEVEPVRTQDSAGYLPKKVSLPFEEYDKYCNLKFPVLATPVMVSEFTQRGVKTRISSFNVQ